MGSRLSPAESLDLYLGACVNGLSPAEIANRFDTLTGTIHFELDAPLTREVFGLAADLGRGGLRADALTRLVLYPDVPIALSGLDDEEDMCLLGVLAHTVDERHLGDSTGRAAVSADLYRRALDGFRNEEFGFEEVERIETLADRILAEESALVVDLTTDETSMTLAMLAHYRAPIQTTRGFTPISTGPFTPWRS